MNILKALFGSYSKRELKRIYPIKDKVLALENKYLNMSDDELREMTNKLKERLASGETLDDILPDAFAVCVEAADRVLGMRPFPVQIVGGIVLHQGRISEMKTGEGKTLVATLPAYLNALSGKGVHIVTVNDYLAKRDCEQMGKVYRFLGLSVDVIVHGKNNRQRRQAYAADITYGTNNEFGFDYLRDNMVSSESSMVQRGHNFAIVDEVDSILIDEARTPLIISGEGDKSTDMYKLADNFVKTLKCIKVTELDDKEDNDYMDGDYIVDEKAKTATLTKDGVKKAEQFFNIENLMDIENMTLQHHINQAVKAHGIMIKDIDYVVKDGEVIIVDEFTGRLMQGRRYNEGLHQAIEAKENVEVQRESKTLATITFQNYFRLYNKLSGMTGTALTEEDEFRHIYKLDVIEIPTNKPVIRVDYHDTVYKTQRGKYNAVIEKIVECNKRGQPVLVGTISIDKSEMLSSLLKKRGVKHNVLNAKYHEKEAEIIAQAGKFGAVTIATNMAGRGTDIMLGGNAEYLAKHDMKKRNIDEEIINQATGFSETDDEEIIEARKLYQALLSKYKLDLKTEAQKVRDAGGLFIIGTERHESRRIDNQLRGRSGRQGDPGATRFYLSPEDDLLRLFGGDRMKSIMDTFGFDEDTPVEEKMLSRTIEAAQKKVEGRNFGIRKNVLQFDDVMNRQRELIYDQRSKVLAGENVSESIQQMIIDVINEAVSLYLPEEDNKENWNIIGLKDYFLGWVTDDEDLIYTPEELELLEKTDIINFLTDKAKSRYQEKESEIGSELLRELERTALLKQVDSFWMDHIDAMAELKRGIYLRSYAQRDPVVEYRLEGFEMFDQMIKSIKENTVKTLLMVHVKPEAQVRILSSDKDLKDLELLKNQASVIVAPSVIETDMKNIVESHGDEKIDTATVRDEDKVGRNELCPCGSGKKYKHCCGK
ncbi:MAG: preprotein translocase subunit SecA [Oscillospiraceae bacterium]|nr:preprotein translocase subunit SecA [Oscillospiraceae bacterium]